MQWWVESANETMCDGHSGNKLRKRMQAGGLLVLSWQCHWPGRGNNMSRFWGKLVNTGFMYKLIKINIK